MLSFFVSVIERAYFAIKDAAMTPHMSSKELALFTSFIKHSRRYLEFGCGGSTCVAARLVKQQVVSVDSSEEWIDKTFNECNEQSGARSKEMNLDMVHVDIGPLKEWGWPADDQTRPNWRYYHSGVWDMDGLTAKDADLVFIDGRFRVACFMQTLLHCRPDVPIMVHDFSNRPEYHAVLEVAFQIASAENLSVFLSKQAPPWRVQEIFDVYAENPA
jgi:hypothetical protein